MANDELAEFCGIKPNFVLGEGEAKEVQSKTSNVKYTVKRTSDHFYCTCPAWRNQSGVPVNARSCKHLLSLLGEEYEEARLETKNPGGPPPKGFPVRQAKGQKPVKPASKKVDENEDDKMDVDEEEPEPTKAKKPASTSRSRKAAAKDRDSEDEDEEEEVKKPSSKSRKPVSNVKRKRAAESSEEDGPTKKSPAQKGKAPAKRPVKRRKNSDTEDEDEEEKMKPRKTSPVKGKTVAKRTGKSKQEDSETEDEDEEVPKKSRKPPSSKGKQPLKRTRKDLSETEDSDEEGSKKSPRKPVSSKGKRPSQRAKKDISETEDEDEEASKKAPRKPVSSKGKKPSKRAKKNVSETEDEDEEEEEPKRSRKPSSSKSQKPKQSKKHVSETDSDNHSDEEQEEDGKKPSSSRKPTSKVKPASKRQNSEESEAEEGESSNNDDDDDDNDDDADGSDNGDALASIKGIKPKVYLKDGDEKEVSSQTSSSTYKIKRTWDHYYCTCPAWRNQSGVPVNARSCKHLISLLGERYEAARVKLKNPEGPALRTPKERAAKKKGKNDGGDSSGKAVSVLLANSWDTVKGPDPTGWWISEKLDGVRTFYDGKQMYSRLGNPFTPPQWFLDKLPKDVTLDGELFGGRGEFQNTVSIVKTVNSPHWKGIKFHVFDIPSIGSRPFESRMDCLKKYFATGTGSHASDKVVLVEQVKAKSRQHVIDKLKEVETLGGEGLMLRKPGSEYEGKRSSTLLKIKSFYDAEAIVTGHKEGHGRNVGVTGALKCKMASGKTFHVGSGLNDKLRKNPPKIGSIIVYRFQELTKDGVPRFPTFLGEAADKTKPKDADVPDHRKGGAKQSDE